MMKIFIVLMLISNVQLSRSNLNVPETNEDLRNLLEQLHFQFYEPMLCVFTDSSDKLTLQSTETNSLYQYTPIIRGNGKEFTEREILSAMDLGYSTFFIAPNSISRTLGMLYNSSVSSIQRKSKRYIILHEGNWETLISLFRLEWTKFLPHVYVLTSSKETAALNAQNSHQYEMLTQRYGNNFQPQGVKVIAPWKANASTFEEKVKKEILLDLVGQHLQLLLTSYSPYVIIQENVVDGTDYRILMEFAKRYNFTWDVDIIHGAFGGLSDDEFTNSFFGRLKDMKYQTGAPAILISESSLCLFDLSVSYTLFGISFLTPKPKQLQYLWSIFTPLKLSTWSCISGFILVCSISFTLFTCLETRLNVFAGNSQYKKFSYALLNSILTTVGQSIPDEERTVMKHLIVWFSMTSTLIITAYNSNLVSFLTRPQLETPVDTLTQFLDSGLSWGLNDIAFLEAFAGEDHSQMEIIRSKNKYFEDVDILNNEARIGKIAVVFEKLYSGHICGVDFLEEDTLAQLYAMKESAVNFHLAFAFQKGSPLLQIFNIFLNQLKDSGIIMQWQEEMVRKYRPQKFELPLSLRSNDLPLLVPLSFIHITGTFILLVFGHGLAFIAFVYEKCMWAWFDRKDN